MRLPACRRPQGSFDVVVDERPSRRCVRPQRSDRGPNVRAIERRCASEEDSGCHGDNVGQEEIEEEHVPTHAETLHLQAGHRDRPTVPDSANNLG